MDVWIHVADAAIGLKTCLKKHRNMGKKYSAFYCGRATGKRYNVARDFSKNARTCERAEKTFLGTAYTRNKKSSDLEPHFPTSTTKSRFLEITKTAVALPHCGESSKESIAGW